MPYTQRRVCPICGKPNLLKLSEHLRQVHDLSTQARQPWLKQASHFPTPVDLSMELMNCPPSSYPVISNSPVPCLTDNRPSLHIQCLDTQPHPDFVFQHPYSMIVVGPSQCGKTHFVHQLLTHKCTVYLSKKPVLVVWCYNQWQPQYEEIHRDLGSNIRFFQGVPELEEDLSEIKTSKHTIFVLDDLMEEAKDSPVVSKLFTQGRHRNASVILLLQNMFPKGKYNTDISRNATYKVLFRSPGDRKQIDIMAEQTFAKDRPRFMQAYNRETAQPYGYIVVDNHPRTSSEHQVVGNVLGDCYTYPHIASTSPRELHPAPREFVEQPNRKRQAPENRDSKKCKVRRVDRSTKKKSLSKQVTRKHPSLALKKSKVKASKKRKVTSRRVPFSKRTSKSEIKKKPRKQPVHDSLEEDDSEEGGDEESASEGEEEDSGDDRETYSEEVDDEPDPGEEEENFRPSCQWRGGPGRIVHEDDADMSPEQAILKEAFYNPHLYPPRRCRRRGGFGPNNHF